MKKTMRPFLLLALLGASPLAGATHAEAAATLACNFKGKTVQVLITNSNDTPRSCNAVCTWKYAAGSFRGVGGAILQSGEAKSVFSSIAPDVIESLQAADIKCNR